MYAPERQQALLETRRSVGRVDVNELAETFDVTPETIRRDLNELERQGLVRRVPRGRHPGRAVGPGTAGRPAHTGQNAELKERIAKAALDHLPDGGSIAIDAGTTYRQAGRDPPADRRFTVVTHALPIAAIAGRSAADHPAAGRRPGPAGHAGRGRQLGPDRVPRRLADGLRRHQRHQHRPRS